MPRAPSRAPALYALALAASVACGTTAQPQPQQTPTPSVDAAAPDATTPPAPPDASPDGTVADARADAGCEGPCASLSLEARYGAKTASFDRAQFGWDKKAGRVSGVTVEVHAGGSPDCPKQSSPTPDRTLIVSGLPLGSAGRTLTLTDGVAVTLIDFKTLLTQKPLDKATAAKVTVAYLEGDAPERVAFDLEATFEEGTIKGHVYAQHCTSMDE